ncbi:MAG: PEP-CTERM sorting domain-containing protein [Betaproteobacteria bacterium]
MRLLQCIGVAGCLVALAIMPARASIWTEVGAGALPGSAELVTVPGLTEIDGHLNFDGDTSQWEIDLYKIYISDPNAFSATTLAFDVFGNPLLIDPVLYLFSPLGQGIFMNDDTAGDNLQSTLPLYSPLRPTAPGYYLLGIGWGFSDAQSDDGSMFPLYVDSLALDGVYGPTGPGGGSPLTSWLPGGPGNFDDISSYRIALTGVPEPGTLALLAAAGIMAAWRRRKAN